MSNNPSIFLKLSGYRAVIEPDRWMPGCHTLVVDGTPQSSVNLEDPTQLVFEYVQRIGNVIDQLSKGPITAVHLGAGALTLPRYVNSTRPGSRQQVVELESDLVDFVREHLPWPRSAAIRIRHGDARETLGKFPAGIRGNVDLLVVDVFGGARIPAHVTSVEFYTEAAELLAPGGVVCVNIADGPGLTFARSQAATLLAATGHAAALAETQIMRGRRYGNIVLVGSASPLPLEWIPRLLAGGPHPARLVAGPELDAWIAGAPIATDATAAPSPTPSQGIFQLGTR